ncbi:MAG: redoxin domain-containing protein [Hyphomonadaceae bacterium]
MKRHVTLTAVGLVLALGAASCAQPGDMVAANDVAIAVQDQAPMAEVAARIDNFRLVSADGYARELYRLKDAPAVVVVMHAAGSPDTAAVAPKLEALKAEWAPKGVEFMMLNSNPNDKREAILADAAKNGITVPVLQDDLQLVGGQIGASRVAQAFVVDPKTWKIAYSGPLTADPIKQLVEGKSASVKHDTLKTQAIAFPSRSLAAKAQFAKISYANEIAPLIEAKCIACHQEGGIAPFGFESYEKVKQFSGMIREAVRTDRMPPWDPDPHVGKFKDDKSLSATQITTLINWIEAGAPRGEGEDRLAKVKHVAPEWPLGKPDLIVDIPKYTIPATGYVDYQYPTVANPLKEGKWLKAATAKVSQRQGVHHILSGVIPEGATSRGMQAWGGGVGGYTVGMESTVAPNGIGSWVPAGGQFGYQMHYTPFGKEAVSAEQIGLYFYKDGEMPDLIMRELPLVDQFIEIPANDGAHKEIAYFDFPKDAILHTAVVHAHYRGTYSKLELMTPDGKRETILNVPFYDFNWQRMYEFEKPIDIPAGSKVIATYVYDNSKRNPANPNPNEKIVWGDQSFEEMFYTSLRYLWKDETAKDQKNYDQLLNRTRLLGMLDDNIDGKVQMAELRGPFKERIGNPLAFGVVDKNKDSGIDMEEFEAVMGQMRRPGRAAPSASAAPMPGNGGQ